MRDQVSLSRGKEQRVVKLPPVLLLDSVTALREAAIAGTGLTIQPEWLVGGALASGQLVRVLPDWDIPTVDATVVYPASRHLPERVRAFVDFAAGELPRLVAELVRMIPAQQRRKN
jgi:DNA-binding transcriptional LysR family regulator